MATCYAAFEGSSSKWRHQKPPACFVFFPGSDVIDSCLKEAVRLEESQGELSMSVMQQAGFVEGRNARLKVR